MYHRLASILFTAVLTLLGSTLVPQQNARGQEVDPRALDDLVSELIYPLIRYEDYGRVSDELAAQGADAVAALTKRLDAANTVGRLRILGTLTRIGPESEPAVPQVLLLLRDQNPFLRAASARFLGALGEAGQQYLPDLMASLDDPDEITVARAARAIATLQPDYMATRLDEFLRGQGQDPYDVKRLPLKTWYRIAQRDASDPELAADLRRWSRIVHFTNLDRVPVGAFLNLPPLGAG